ncbi:DEAD/DEAH box helicase domain protein [Pelodictyon phaeoclathratiforme BU-1]|uniref:DEAD/DEAH box helicase domain protein n=2 Tax=Pelodictyon phaeoclathratiforme TaxID=34090 RepID=B4SBA5_PELPB|nr:DEAD/DEAH box helicase domain protein [Pelodictyon phaeoclathratiforme BU-1]
MHPLNSDESQAFFLLDEKIQRWIWEQKWMTLRDAQERAIAPILAGNTDVIIAAATATGKTEAAFLPICSKLLAKECQNASVLYISPLKALINDQFSRMEQLCERLDIPVHPWHGDVSVSKKGKFLKKPTGILLITPESVEALFVNHGSAVPQIFNNLLYIVIDELHSFIGSERGQQLQSLLHRIEFAIKRKIPRIGLSATIGDMHLASRFLRPETEAKTVIIVSNATGQELQLLLRGYVNKAPLLHPIEETEEVPPDGSSLEIGEDLFKTLRGKSNLIFPNSREQVENFSDLLRNKCEEQHLPNEFWPHHGNLAKGLREEAEAAIKDKSHPVNIVCTSTLEMGIDIGSVISIAQIGVPPSVASLRQRLGRSGRKDGDPAILRIYIQENEVTISSKPLACLRSNLIQTIAMVRLLLEKWYEPPPSGGLHLSTMVQQLLSLIAQYGGITAVQAYNLLCKNGAFQEIGQQMFVDLLRTLGNQRLIMQASDGLLLHGQLGERIVNHYSFYAAFTTPEEYRLLTGDRTLGTLPLDRPVEVNSLLIFGGRRWTVLDVDAQKKVISLKPATGKKLPQFDGQAGRVHDQIRKEMFAVYTEKGIPIFLDAQAKELLGEAREAFDRLSLSNKKILIQGNETYLFCWMGDKILDTLVAMLRSKGLTANNYGIAIEISSVSPNKLQSCLRALLKEGVPDAYELARSVANKATEKYDNFLTDELLSADYAASKFDAEGAFKVLTSIM